MSLFIPPFLPLHPIPMMMILSTMMSILKALEILLPTSSKIQSFLQTAPSFLRAYPLVLLTMPLTRELHYFPHPYLLPILCLHIPLIHQLYLHLPPPSYPNLHPSRTMLVATSLVQAHHPNIFQTHFQILQPILFIQYITLILLLFPVQHTHLKGILHGNPKKIHLPHPLFLLHHPKAIIPISSTPLIKPLPYPPSHPLNPSKSHPHLLLLTIPKSHVINLMGHSPINSSPS